MTAVYNNTYKYIKGLGEGAFGKVFLAKEDRSEKLVAIKEFKSADLSQQKSILREIQTVSRFHREHIVGYMTNFTQDGRFFLVLEYCEKGDLWSVTRAQKLNSEDIINYVRDVANEIQFLHNKDIIHRDIKPA
ncbi:protein kinase, partial [Pleurocapsales cyanobacterium LEGE 10410]|nr:protein kinase [Pleurocapsales cyanobacterium LEGE 10410]